MEFKILEYSTPICERDVLLRLLSLDAWEPSPERESPDSLRERLATPSPKAQPFVVLGMDGERVKAAIAADYLPRSGSLVVKDVYAYAKEGSMLRMKYKANILSNGLPVLRSTLMGRDRQVVRTYAFLSEDDVQAADKAGFRSPMVNVATDGGGKGRIFAVSVPLSQFDTDTIGKGKRDDKARILMFAAEYYEGSGGYAGEPYAKVKGKVDEVQDELGELALYHIPSSANYDWSREKREKRECEEKAREEERRREREAEREEADIRDILGKAKKTESSDILKYNFAKWAARKDGKQRGLRLSEEVFGKISATAKAFGIPLGVMISSLTERIVVEWSQLDVVKTKGYSAPAFRSHSIRIPDDIYSDFLKVKQNGDFTVNDVFAAAVKAFM